MTGRVSVFSQVFRKASPCQWTYILLASTIPYFKRSYVYVSYARSFRYPRLDELFSYFNNTINTALVPQVSNNFEAGVRHYFNDFTYMHVNTFRLDTKDEIFYNPVTFQNESMDGKTRRQGVEISLEARPVRVLTVRGSYTYMSAKIMEGVFSGSDVPNVPSIRRPWM